MLGIQYGISVGVILALLLDKTFGMCSHDVCARQMAENQTGAGLEEVPRTIGSITGEICGLNLENNDISSLFDNAFQHYSRLKNISLKNNDLSDISEAAFCGIEVTYLNLESNKLDGVPRFLCNAGVHVPLTILHLGHNNIETIKESFRDLPDLKCIYLEDNNINSIDPDIFYDMGSIVDLNFAHNHLTDIDPQTFCGTSLRWLNLASNRLSEIPNLSCVAGKLENLNLAHNFIKVIHATSLNGLSNLTRLRLENNDICCIDSDTFRATESLSYLNIAHNRLNAIDNSIFCGTRLVSINLASNHLTDVPNLSCIGKTLRNLKLNDNLIQRLDRSSFMKLFELKILSLEKNTIHYIDPATFSDIDVCQVYIADNQLFCMKLVSSNFYCILQ